MDTVASAAISPFGSEASASASTISALPSSATGSPPTEQEQLSEALARQHRGLVASPFWATLTESSSSSEPINMLRLSRFVAGNDVIAVPDRPQASNSWRANAISIQHQLSDQLHLWTTRRLTQSFTFARRSLPYSLSPRRAPSNNSSTFWGTSNHQPYANPFHQLWRRITPHQRIYAGLWLSTCSMCRASSAVFASIWALKQYPNSDRWSHVLQCINRADSYSLIYSLAVLSVFSLHTYRQRNALERTRLSLYLLKVLNSCIVTVGIHLHTLLHLYANLPRSSMDRQANQQNGAQAIEDHFVADLYALVFLVCGLLSIRDSFNRPIPWNTMTCSAAIFYTCPTLLQLGLPTANLLANDNEHFTLKTRHLIALMYQFIALN